MFRLFKRQRRRLALFALFAALPIAAIAFVSALTPWGFAAAIGVAASIGFGLMALPIVILRFAPRFRSASDGMILGVVVGIALQIATLPLADIPMVGPWRAGIGLLLLVLFFYSDAPNRLLPARDYVGKRSFRTKQSVYTLWAEHLPDPGLLDRHWSCALHNLVMDRFDPRVRIATYCTDEGGMRQRQHITEETTYTSFAYDFTQLLPDGSDGPTGAYSLNIQDHGLYREVTICQRVDALPFMAWLNSWLDDIVGDECDHHVARSLHLPDASITGGGLRKAPHRLVGPVAPQAVAA